MAISLHAWVQVDEANREPSDADRLALLKAADQEVTEALVLNPNVGMLNLASLRIKATLRDQAGILKSAEQLQRLSRQNSDFPVYAAMFLAFWRQPEAAQVLDDAGSVAYPSPYVAVGRFALALAADDPVAASKQISGIQAVEASQPALRVVEAAYFSRVGQNSRARALLTQFCRRSFIVGMTPEIVMRRLPVDDLILRQLGQWLEPLKRQDPKLMQCH
jgi:hypothetical protein